MEKVPFGSPRLTGDSKKFLQSTDGYGSIPIDTFLVGWTSICQLFWGSLGTRVLTHPQMSTACFWTSDDKRYSNWILAGRVINSMHPDACPLDADVDVGCAPFTTRYWYSTVVSREFLPEWCVAHEHLASNSDLVHTHIHNWPNKMETRRIQDLTLKGAPVKIYGQGCS